MKKQRLLLFDGNNLIFRSFHAIKELSTSNGTATNAVYGVLKSFRATVAEFKPDYVIVCWDSGKATFRHRQDPAYKADRPVTSSDLKSQFPLVQEALNCLGVPQITATDVECDDLIGTLATKGSKAGFAVTIVSSDKDFFQLCNEDITIFSFTVRKKNDNGIVDVDYIRKNFEVEPSQLVDIKSLTGEKTDNIIGVKGIGEKTATKLIKEHGTIFECLKFLQNNRNIPERQRVIIESIDVIANAYTLAKIKTDVPVPEIPVRPVEKLVIDEARLRAFFTAYEMNTFLREMNSWTKIFTYKTPSFN